MNVKIFESRLDQKEGEPFSVMSLPSYNIRLNKIQSDKYKLIFSKKEDDIDMFANEKGIGFEIHFQEDVKVHNDAGELEEKGSMTGLYFFNGKRGWYIDSAECETGMDVVLSIGRMLTKRLKDNMMENVFKRALDE